MITQIKSWGNSQGIRITREMMETSGFKLGDNLLVTTEQGKILITVEHERLTLKDRIAKYGPIKPHAEVDWGDAVGDERW